MKRKFRLSFLPVVKEEQYTNEEVEAIKAYYESMLKEERQQAANLYTVIEAQQEKIFQLQSQLITCKIFINRTENKLKKLKEYLNL